MRDLKLKNRISDGRRGRLCAEISKEKNGSWANKRSWVHSEPLDRDKENTYGTR
jgi:hypothetical protein